MNKGKVAIWTTTIAVMATVLSLGVTPGALADYLLLAIALTPFAGLLGLVAGIVYLFQSSEDKARLNPWIARIAVASCSIIGALGFVATNIPCRLAFRIHRHGFDQVIEEAALTGDGEKEINQRIGFYFVDQAASDPRGGVYLRVHTGPDGLGPDTMSYGFAFQPNIKGSPFGAAHYSLSQLSENWFSFRASNDWF